MLYTDCVYNIDELRNIPNVIQICIMRFKPVQLNILKSDVYHFIDLSPSPELLNRIKSNEINFNEFEELLVDEMLTNDEAKRAIFKIGRWLSSNYDVVLYCEEKSDKRCHRSSIRNQFKSLGFESRELKKGDYDDIRNKTK